MTYTRSEQFKKLLEIIIIAIVVIIGFGFATHSFAYTITQQLIKDTTETSANSYIGQQLGKGLSGSLTSITFSNGNSINNSSSGIQLTDCGTISQCTTFADFSGAGTFSGYIFTVSSTIRDITWNTTTTLLADHYYALLISNNGGGDDYVNGSVSSSTYQSGNCYRFYSGAMNPCTNIGDIYFILSASGTIPSAISITYPVNGTSTRDFSAWSVSASGNISTVQINYGDNFSSYSDKTTFNISTNGFVNLPISKIHTLSVSTSSVYFATPYILNASGTVVATGTTIFFQINNTLNNISTSTAFAQNFAQYIDNVNNNVRKIPFNSSDSCNPFSLFSCFIDAMTFLGDTFIFPHQGSMDVLNSSMQNYTCTNVNDGTLISGCTGIFPFNVFFTFANQAKNVASSTYDAEQNFNIPLTGLGSTSSITLFSSTTVNTAIGSSSKSTYFTYANAIMYFLTGYKILITILL